MKFFAPVIVCLGPGFSLFLTTLTSARHWHQKWVFYMSLGGTCLICFACQMLCLLQFGAHDVVILKPNKADSGSPSLGQGVVYRLKVVLLSISFFGMIGEGLNL